MPRRSYYRLGKRSPIAVVLVTLVVALGQHYGWFGAAKQAAMENQPGLYRVTEFVDGDTVRIDMNGKEETIRMIGVDTPETHDPRKSVQCYGQAAAAFTKQLINNNSVRLEADQLNTNRDRYNRLLRYVYLPNGALVNAEIIKQGYGFAYLSFPFTKSDEFRQYQTNAMNSDRGLWGKCQPTKNQYGGYTSNNAQ